MLAALVLLRLPARGDAGASADGGRSDTTSFATLVARLSEPGGFFDSDNLISNETSYLHVLGQMRTIGVSGGAYIGVGPDQNFSYMAQLRPTVAYLIDIRRDNLLQHLLYKAMFAAAPTRVEFLSLWTGRSAPKNAQDWKAKPVEQLVEYIDRSPSDSVRWKPMRDAVLARVRSYGVPLDSASVATISKIVTEFATAGLDIRFTSMNRAPRPYYPTLRQLLLEKDLTGRQGSFLAREEDYAFLRDLEGRGLVIPVVGDLSGSHAMAAIAKDVAARGVHVSAFYTSNVEFYLYREGTFGKFMANVRRLPRDAKSVVIRSYFGGGFGMVLPQTQPGYYSTQLLQPLDALVAGFDGGAFATYQDLVTR